MSLRPLRLLSLLVSLIVVLLSSSWFVVAADDVRLLLNGSPASLGNFKPADIQSLIISNGLLAITFGKDANGDFSGTSVIKDGQELAHNLHGVEPRDVDARRTFYLDYGAGRGHLEVDTVKVIKVTPDQAHFAVADTHNPTQLEHHFVMMRGQSGVYAYVIIRTPRGGGGGEMRTMYRFDRDILDWAYTPERTGQQPKYAYLQTLPRVQDETWRLPDGSIYQKYDYSVYYSEAPLWGHYGHGFGVFFMPVSTEYYSGGPMRQELVVHQDALILNYIGGGHYGGGGSAAGRNGEKIHGPWFLYFNTGATPEAIIADAKRIAAEEQAKWPYPWIEEPLYPTKRTRVTGQIKVKDGRSAGGCWVIFARPGGNIYNQSGDYIFYTRADADGKFALPHVRPGNYSLYAWATQGSITDELQKDGIEAQGDALDLGVVEWAPPRREHLLWQIGKADQMAGEFKFGNELRNIKWISLVPTNLTFTIGQSREAQDWYYAQRAGNWDVVFNLDRTYSSNAWLTVAIAGGSGRVNVSVNDQPVGSLSRANDATIYRAAVRSGRYGLEEFKFAASLLKVGRNIVRFSLPNGAPNNGIMYDTILLEAD